MATPSAGDVNKQLWDEALTRLLDLSTATVKRNTELETRVDELELELSVWKQAHAAVADGLERERKTHNAHVATLNCQIFSGILKNQDPLILCVLDGNANTFSHSMLTQGQQGGRLAAQELTKRIAEYLSQEELRLLNSLLGEAICTADQLEAFMSGLSQASPRFLLVDIGQGKDDADIKIKEYLQTYMRLPQTLRVFFGGGQGDNYTSTFKTLEGEQLIGKLVMLQCGSEVPEEVQQFPIPSMQVDGLFMQLESIHAQRRPGPIPLASLNNVTTNGGLISPQSETQSSASAAPSRSIPVGRPIDPTKPLHKQSPPPCNEHYLMTCSKGLNCKYSHEWALTNEQLEILAKNAKKAPCNYLKNGLECPHGGQCCWGHFCPSGARCFHLSKGKCWFKGEGMHPRIAGVTAAEAVV